MSRTRTRREDDPEYQRSRPDGFPEVKKIVFGEVWPCWKCHGVGFKEPKKRKTPCIACEGKGWLTKERRDDGMATDSGGSK